MFTTTQRGKTIEPLMSISLFSTLKISDLRRLESSLSLRLECLKAFQAPNHDKNVLWLTIAPEGMKLSQKHDYLQHEINAMELLLENVKSAILNY